MKERFGKLPWYMKGVFILCGLYLIGAFITALMMIPIMPDIFTKPDQLIHYLLIWPGVLFTWFVFMMAAIHGGK